MERSLEVVVLPVSDIDASIRLQRDDGLLARRRGTFFGFADPDGNTWAVQELKVRAERPLIPPEHRGRFG